jgi:hypothetical protein
MSEWIFLARNGGVLASLVGVLMVTVTLLTFLNDPRGMSERFDDEALMFQGSWRMLNACKDWRTV